MRAQPERIAAKGFNHMSIGGIGGFSASSLATRIFERADKDKSGGVNFDELSAFTANSPAKSSRMDGIDKELFTAFDTDQDGSLTESELRTGLDSFSREIQLSLLALQETGSNATTRNDDAAIGDRLSAQLDALKELFAAIDKDGDGNATADELSAFQSALEEERTGPRDRDEENRRMDMANLLIGALNYSSSTSSASETSTLVDSLA
jgi:Ca2+-binding EF-hand superfamily protein